MKETDKLRVLIPHWIEHNKEHVKEFRDWTTHAGDASADILSAIEIMYQTNTALESALKKLGGPLSYQHFHGESHDHHHHGEADDHPIKK